MISYRLMQFGFTLTHWANRKRSDYSHRKVKFSQSGWLPAGLNSGYLITNQASYQSTHDRSKRWSVLGGTSARPQPHPDRSRRSVSVTAIAIWVGISLKHFIPLILEGLSLKNPNDNQPSLMKQKKPKLVGKLNREVAIFLCDPPTLSQTTLLNQVEANHGHNAEKKKRYVIPRIFVSFHKFIKKKFSHKKKN